jgi:iron(III) transport system permease protein
LSHAPGIYKTPPCFTNKSGGHKQPVRRRLTGLSLIAAIGACTAILMVSFILPLGQVIYWVSLTAHKVIDQAFWSLVANSFLLAMSASVLIVIFATILLYSARINRIPWVKYASEMAVLGYAIPGAVIAIGIYLPVVSVDQWLVRLTTGSNGLYLSLTVFMLIFAYMVRFMAVAYHTISSGFQKTGTHVSEASRMLGASSWQTLFRIDIPMIKNSMGAALLLVFVDIIKELPLTLILRPFNFHTLATKAFDMATNEQIAESANASLFVLLIGLLPVMLLNNLVKDNMHD